MSLTRSDTGDTVGEDCGERLVLRCDVAASSSQPEGWCLLWEEGSGRGSGCVPTVTIPSSSSVIRRNLSILVWEYRGKEDVTQFIVNSLSETDNFIFNTRKHVSDFVYPSLIFTWA